MMSYRVKGYNKFGVVVVDKNVTSTANSLAAVLRMMVNAKEEHTDIVRMTVDIAFPWS